MSTNREVLVTSVPTPSGDSSYCSFLKEGGEASLGGAARGKSLSSVECDCCRSFVGERIALATANVAVSPLGLQPLRGTR